MTDSEEKPPEELESKGRDSNHNVMSAAQQEFKVNSTYSEGLQLKYEVLQNRRRRSELTHV